MQGSTIVEKGPANDPLAMDGSPAKHHHNLSTNSPYRVNITAPGEKNPKPSVESSIRLAGNRQSAHGGDILIKNAMPLLGNFKTQEIVVEGRHANLNEPPKSREQQRLKD